MIESIIEKEELISLLPHRGKMFLLSRVTGYDTQGSISAEYDITEQCIFYDPVLGGVPAWAGFECMAQTVSALAGLRCREKGEKPKIGFILSVPSMKIDIDFFKSGVTLKLNMQETDRTDLIYTFEGEAFVEDKKVMEGKLMVMEIYNEQFNDFIREHT